SASLRRSIPNGSSISSKSSRSDSASFAPTRIPADRNLSASASNSRPRNIQSRRSLRSIIKEMLLQRFEDRIEDFHILRRGQMNLYVVPQASERRLCPRGRIGVRARGRRVLRLFRLRILFLGRRLSAVGIRQL